MRAAKKHRIIRVENILRAVAVVHVPIENRDSLDAVDGLRVPGRHGDMVEKAEAHGAIRRRMVSGRSHRAKGVIDASGQRRIDGVHHATRRQSGNFPRTRANAHVAVGERAFAVRDRVEHGFDVTRIVRATELVDRGQPGRNFFEFRGQVGEGVEQAIDSLRRLRVIPACVVFLENRIEQQAGNQSGYVLPLAAPMRSTQIGRARSAP